MLICKTSFGESLMAVTLAACFVLAASCSGADSSGSRASVIIRITGSDTMVNLVQAWAENYKNKRPDVAVQVAGGGSGVGIAGLIDGILDIAASSREIEPGEVERATQQNGVKPTEFKVALDGLAIYTHRSNPIEQISIEELADIYGEGGSTHQVVAARRQQSILPQRRDHPRQQTKQLRDLRLLPRGASGYVARAQDGVNRPERFQGCRGPRFQDALRDWI